MKRHGIPKVTRFLGHSIPNTHVDKIPDARDWKFESTLPVLIGHLFALTPSPPPYFCGPVDKFTKFKLSTEFI